MTTPLAGKVALVTGGSRGIGAAIAARLARDGAAVALSYARGREKADGVVSAIEAAGGRALAIQADSGDAGAVKAAVAKTVAELGRLDVLVNNAGLLVVAPIDEFSLEEFDRMIAVNVRGVFVATQAAVRHMGEGGRVIMIGSVNAGYVPFVGGSVYALTKGALGSFVRGLARDLGPRGITVNNIEPGPTDTDMNPAGGPNADFLRDHIAVKRFARGDEIAGMVSYLAGPEGAFVTGTSLRIDGGFAA
jgi:3-oxoacyl-[acyl-carrier protein] reductase